MAGHGASRTERHHDRMLWACVPKLARFDACACGKVAHGLTLITIKYKEVGIYTT